MPDTVAIGAFGTMLQIETTEDNFEDVIDFASINLSLRNQVQNVSSMSSLNPRYKATMQSIEAMSFEVFFNMSEPTHEALYNAFKAKEAASFKFQLPDDGVDPIEFLAIVEQMTFDEKHDDVQRCQVQLIPSGDFVLP